MFDNYGHVREYPRRAQLTGFEWSLECDLDISMAFLKDANQLQQVIGSQDGFMDFLAGFFDAEGSVYFHKKSLHGGFEVSISNVDARLLEEIRRNLFDRGYSPTLRVTRQAPQRGVKNGGDTIWRLTIWKWDQVNRLLQSMGVRHPEKVEKRKVALTLEYRSSREKRDAIVAGWNRVKERIVSDREHYKDEARLALGEEISA